MDKTDAVSNLGRALASFEVNARLLPELLNAVKRTSHRVRFFELFYNRLDFLRENGRLAAARHKEFERIDNDIYSMHIVVPDLNLRILYSFLDDGTVLLCAFDERQGKRNTDYTNQLPVAHRRKHEMEE